MFSKKLSLNTTKVTLTHGKMHTQKEKITKKERRLLRKQGVIVDSPINSLNPIVPLTQNQKKAFEAYKKGKNLLLHGSAGTGKAQPLYSKVLTRTGWKPMGDVMIGDEVITPKGNYSKIIGIFPQGKKDIYEITFHDGAKTRCCLDHLWNVYVPDSNKKGILKTITTKEIISILQNKENKNLSINLAIDLSDPVPYNDKVLPIDPYLMGALIGDGGLSVENAITFTTKDDEILQYLSERIDDTTIIKKTKSGKYDYRIVGNGSRINGCLQKSTLNLNLKNLNLMGTRSHEKFIPSEYLEGSISQRWELLQGLMDTDGTTDGCSSNYSTTSLQLAKDVQTLAWSLGCTATLTKRKTYYTYKNDKREGKTSYRITIGCKTPSKLFKLSRKKNKAAEYFDNSRTTLRRRIKSVSLVDNSDAQCIMIDDPDHLYITDDYIVTHNTFIALYLALNDVINNNKYKKVIIIRSTVPSRDMGFLPGTHKEKAKVYETPYHTICSELFGQPSAYTSLKQKNQIEFISTSFIRGTTINDAVIIVDEMQNLNWMELSTSLTRVGDNCKVILSGDTRQSDLSERDGKHDLLKIMNVCKRMNIFHFVQMTTADIVRSGFVKDFIITCEELGY